MLLTSENYPLTVYIRQTIEEFVRRMEDDPSIASAYDFSQFSVRYAFLVCSIIPIIVIYPKLQKYFAAGVNVGGVKE
jgi:putative aldouronate transport system permease protein